MLTTADTYFIDIEVQDEARIKRNCFVFFKQGAEWKDLILNS